MHINTKLVIYIYNLNFYFLLTQRVKDHKILCLKLSVLSLTSKHCGICSVIITPNCVLKLIQSNLKQKIIISMNTITVL